MRMSHREGSSEDTGGGEEHSLERVHAKGHVHARAVRQEGSKGCLLKQPEDQDLIPGGTGRAGTRGTQPAPPPTETEAHPEADGETDMETHGGQDRKREAKTDPGRW